MCPRPHITPGTLLLARVGCEGLDAGKLWRGRFVLGGAVGGRGFGACGVEFGV